MMKISKKFLVACNLLVAAMALNYSSACGKKPGETTPEAAAPAPAPEKKAEGAAAPAPAAPAAPAAAPAAGGANGSIKGKVSFTGTAPAMPDLNRDADPFCAKTKMKDQEIVVNSNGTLKNVALTITNGATPVAAPDTVAKVEVDQSNCMYSPRVMTGISGQNFSIVNSDPILHNVHTYAGAKTLFNRAQPKGSPPVDK